jgi:hypothetical protein
MSGHVLSKRQALHLLFITAITFKFKFKFKFQEFKKGQMDFLWSVECVCGPKIDSESATAAISFNFNPLIKIPVGIQIQIQFRFEDWSRNSVAITCTMSNVK